MREKNATSVSVVMAAYNAEATIRRAVESVIHDPLIAEVIVVDDSSNDDTSKIVSDMMVREHKLQLARLPAVSGPAAARNLAIGIASCDWISVLDADDFMLPGRMAKLVSHSAEADFIADDLLFCRDPNGQIYHRNILEHSDRFLDFETFVAGNLSARRKNRTELGFLKPVMSARFIRSTALAYPEHMMLGEDYAFYAQALLAGARFKLIDACGYVSLERPDSISSKHSIVDLERLYEFDLQLLRKVYAEPARTALRQHLADTKDRLQLRRFLNEKAHKRYLRMLRAFFESSRSANYISRQMIKAKLGLG